jgi:hypothetical protein
VPENEMVIALGVTITGEKAVNSLDEGIEETLLLQRLGMFEKLGKSFKTTTVSRM